MVLVALLVVVVTLVVQGLTLAPLIRALGVASDADVGADVRRLQRDVTQAALEVLRHADGVPDDVRAAVVRQYEARLDYREEVQQFVDSDAGRRRRGTEPPGPARAGQRGGAGRRAGRAPAG